MGVFFVSLVIKILLVLLSIAFITLFERKLLRLSQTRIGPNKVVFMGIFQPVIDGVKLLIKEFFFPKKRLFWGILLGPFIGFLTMALLWGALNHYFGFSSSFYSIVFIIVVVGVGLYSTLVSGWRSTSKFGSIGAIRSCSQSVSYEIALIFLLFIFLIIGSSTRRINKINLWLAVWVFPLVWLRCVAETNRAPFDFREGERELISGFNVEFGAASFVLLFLAEYGIILFFSFFLATLFKNNSFFFSVCIILSFIFIRRVYPRFRYDMLIKITWTRFLPFSLVFVGRCFFWLFFFSL